MKRRIDDLTTKGGVIFVGKYRLSPYVEFDIRTNRRKGRSDSRFEDGIAVRGIEFRIEQGVGSDNWFFRLATIGSAG